MKSLSKNARIAGLLYLTLMTAPLRLIYIPSKLFVAGNSSATANNIAAHETLFRLGILSDLFTATMGIFLAFGPLPAVQGSRRRLGSADGDPRRADGDAHLFREHHQRRSRTAARPGGRLPLCLRQAPA
jgi:hypothetical protein